MSTWLLNSCFKIIFLVECYSLGLSLSPNTTNFGNSRYIIWTCKNLACLIFKSFLKQETERLESLLYQSHGLTSAVPERFGNAEPNGKITNITLFHRTEPNPNIESGSGCSETSDICYFVRTMLDIPRPKDHQNNAVASVILLLVSMYQRFSCCVSHCFEPPSLHLPVSSTV